jgi:hypothetical protein
MATSPNQNTKLSSLGDPTIRDALHMLLLPLFVLALLVGAVPVRHVK